MYGLKRERRIGCSTQKPTQKSSIWETMSWRSVPLTYLKVNLKYTYISVKQIKELLE